MDLILQSKSVALNCTVGAIFMQSKAILLVKEPTSLGKVNPFDIDALGVQQEASGKLAALLDAFQRESKKHSLSINPFFI
jgi:hypothetical protein